MRFLARLPRLSVVLSVVAVGLIVATEVLKKGGRAREATILSMIAWSLLFVAFLDWALFVRGWRAAVRDLLRIALLTAVAGAVLYLYFVRSGTLEAGVHIDAAYSYVGLTWFTELHNPITFVAPNPSYVQLPLMELGHLPALWIGFDRLGAFSCIFGTMLQTAVLLAVMTILFVPRGLLWQAVTAGLAAAVFSNRMLVLTHDNFGYSVPAICLGFMFMVVVDDDSIPEPDRAFGGLLLVAVLHHYSGLTQVLPLALGWLVFRWHGVRRLPAFLARNPLLLASAAMLVAALAINPDPFTARLKDVTVGIGHRPAFSEFAQNLLTKAQGNWRYLVGAYPGSYFHQLYVDNGGSWVFVNIPPLGGRLVPLVVGAWVLSALTLRGRRLRYLGWFVALVAGLLALAILQHLLTDFADYRDLTAIWTLLVSSLLFVFRAPRCGRYVRAIALGYAVGFAVFNFVDLGKLQGKVHNSGEYAHVSQRTMERLARYLKRQPPESVGVTRIHVVLDSIFPLKPLYLETLARYGVPIEVVDGAKFCEAPAETVEKASAAGCDGFLFVTDSKRCVKQTPPGGDPGWTIQGERYGGICGRPEAGLQDRARVPVPLGGDGASPR